MSRVVPPFYSPPGAGPRFPATPLQIGGRLEGDPQAQSLSVAFCAVDKQLGRVFVTEKRRSWVTALPTESGEKASSHLLLLL